MTPFRYRSLGHCASFHLLSSSKFNGWSASRQGFDDQSLGFIASRLRQAAFAGGEVIFERGERGDEMYLILEGAVVLNAGPRAPASAETSDRGISQQRTALGGSKLGLNVGASDLAAGERIAGKGDVFGEGGLFPEEMGTYRLESAKTLSFVSAFVLTAASMREIEAECPAVNSLRSYALACLCGPAFSCATAVKFLSLSSKTEI
jgi:CRP-like cAMP-binding protein